MNLLWADPSNGAAGDMLLGALLDAGADRSVVAAGLRALRVEPIELQATEVRRHGFRATKADVTAPETTTHRGLPDLLAIIGAAALPAAAHDLAATAFTRLAEAEARVHGIPVTDVHFHEVGALDAIADVVGCALALHDLGLLAPGAVRVVGPVAAGSGTGRSAHGRMPLPAPAVLEILTAAGAPMAAHPATMELCTPTGAALLVALATAWGPPPAMTARAVGAGAGTRDPDTHPNILRVLLGTGAGAAAATDWSATELSQIEATIDDLDPRVWPDLLERLRSVGAADAWCTPVLMRKGRPGQVLTVLAGESRIDLVCRQIFTHTTTLGLRIHGVRRLHLRRDEVKVTVAGQPVAVKRGYLGPDLVTVQPEYDDALAAATATGRPVADVIDQARREATEK
ncbi:nickel pincer cofactor biosynthesis protein LarC [Actinoplanes sp. NPDC049265]|uniref:nickel pincer cofactor biosynthesis protein LarC n=1 Tax=Actinoplanes sp. NPDC049265 TaxID=3363902 RepID=UPI0037118432